MSELLEKKLLGLYFIIVGIFFVVILVVVFWFSDDEFEFVVIFEFEVIEFEVIMLEEFEVFEFIQLVLIVEFEEKDEVELFLELVELELEFLDISDFVVKVLFIESLFVSEEIVNCMLVDEGLI